MERAGGQPIEYWRASETLAPFVSGYHRYSVPLPPGVTLHDVVFPSWATIRIAMPGSRGWSVRFGSRRYDDVPQAAMFGPTSYAGYLEARGGTLVGAGILPHGWAAMFGGDVSRFANRVVPLSAVDADAASLEAAIGDGVRPDLAFEEWLGLRAGRHEPDPRIARIFAMLDDPAIARIETIAEALAMSQRVLADFTRAHFGFTPKLLLRRSRFLRALSAVLAAPEDGPSALSAAGYWDRSHFLRDSHAFLGCSVREFVRRRGPMNQMAMDVRAEVIGSAV